jgi:hypothetical protein
LLKVPFGTEEVVVATAPATRVTPADPGTSVVDRAASLFAIEKAAHGTEVLVHLMPHHPLPRLVSRFRILPLCFLDGDAEVARQTTEICLRDSDVRIGAAVRRTALTVVENSKPLGHAPILRALPSSGKSPPGKGGRSSRSAASAVFRQECQLTGSARLEPGGRGR